MSLADMKLLELTAPEVYAEFMHGNFIVKRTKRRFSQILADQAAEWINKRCQMQTGIIDITRNGQTKDKEVLCHLGRTLSNLSGHEIPLQPER